MSFAKNLMTSLSSQHLLKHPFYVMWTDGTLPRETIRTYAGQYFHHVSAFPRYLSATHSACENLATRQLLLENLIDEEQGPENHPELWLRFAETMGQDRESIANLDLFPETRALVDTFLAASRSSFEEGLGVLFAYEHQVPEIAQFKLEALAKHYGVTEGSEGAKFFDVHRKADVYHTQALSAVIDALPESAQLKVQAAARNAAAKLWGFLDGIQSRMSHAA